MQNYGVMIDLDGVIYSGTTLIPGALDFIAHIKNHKIPFVFTTNNSEKHPDAYVQKLVNLGINITSQQLYSSSLAAVSYVKANWPNGNVLCIGEDGLKTLLQDQGLAVNTTKKPDCILVGETRSLCYQTLCQAARYVEKGIPLLATNPDITIPTTDGLIIGCGAITHMLELTVNKQAKYFGKPNKVMAEGASSKMNVPLENLLMIGDNLQTDIAFANNLKIPAILVLSGLTKPEAIASSPYAPTRVVDSVAELIQESPFDWWTEIGLA